MKDFRLVISFGDVDYSIRSQNQARHDLPCFSVSSRVGCKDPEQPWSVRVDNYGASPHEIALDGLCGAVVSSWVESL